MEAQSKLEKLLRDKHAMLQYQCSAKSIRDRNMNSTFFQAYVSIRKVNKPFSSLKVNGRLSSNLSEIGQHVLGFYFDLFNVSILDLKSIDESLLAEVGLVFHNDNAMLAAIPIWDEVRDVVFDIDPSSASRPDGFTGKFFKFAWVVVSEDVCRAVCFFFSSGLLSIGLNSNFLTLIPKVENADVLESFHPIVLGNFLFEVISKIISSQLGLITRRIISPNQFGFIKVRQIQYCIVVAFDYVNSLGQKFYRGNMAMKIDIRKAFDTLCWDFHLYF